MTINECRDADYEIEWMNYIIPKGTIVLLKNSASPMLCLNDGKLVFTRKADVDKFFEPL